MANTKSAKKMVRKIEQRAKENRARRSRVRTSIRSVEEAIVSGDREAASAALRAAQPEIVRGAQKGLYHQRTAARKVSRLAVRVQAMAP
ncbi:MAG: 30S ribosomal protein S20 [Alphaproteobacteria bacterium]